MSKLRLSNLKIKYLCEAETKDWYIVFEPRRGEFRFWHLFTRKNFDHVWAYTPLANSSLVICPNPRECLVEEWGLKAEEIAQFLSDDVTAVLKFKAYYPADKRYTQRGLINCVVLVKCFLGVSCFSLTPRGLYKQLKKMGAQNVK